MNQLIFWKISPWPCSIPPLSEFRYLIGTCLLFDRWKIEIEREKEREKETEEKARNISVSLIERWQLTCYINFQVTQFDSSLRVSLITKLPSSTSLLYAIFFNFVVNFAPSCSFFSSFESGRKFFKFVCSIKKWQLIYDKFYQYRRKFYQFFYKDFS